MAVPRSILRRNRVPVTYHEGPAAGQSARNGPLSCLRLKAVTIMMTLATPLEPHLQQRLISAALAARAHAYVRYSKFPVGAALLAGNGAIYSGANVENASYGLTICAERVAVHTAVAGGEREFRALAVATGGGSSPCGACRQVLAEFCNELPILLVDADRAGHLIMTQLSELLPNSFRLHGE